MAPVEGSFSFLCLHAAVALTPLLPSAHSLLLTSGTLSPMDPLVAELGLGAKPGVTPKPEPRSDTKPETKLDDASQHMGTDSGIGDTIPAWAKPKVKPEAASADEVKPEALANQSLGQHDAGTMAGVADPKSAALPAAASVKRESASPMASSGYAGTLPGSTHTSPPAAAAAASASTSNQEQEAPALPESMAKVQPASPSAATAATSVISTEAKEEPAASPAAASSSNTRRASHASASASGSPEGGGSAPEGGGGARQRSKHSRLHQEVELVSAPHNPTLPSRLLPLTISMAPGRSGQLVKLDSAFDRRQDEGKQYFGFCMQMCMCIMK